MKSSAALGVWSPLVLVILHYRYIRYTFAGRVFEETFQDNDEVSLPSPTSTYMGEDDVCSATTPRRGELLQT